MRSIYPQGNSHTPDQIVEACASIVDECNREGPYAAVGAASRIRELKGMFVPVIQSEATRAKDERIAELERIVRQSLVDHESVKFSDLFGSRVQVSEPCDCYRCEEIRAALSNTSPSLQGATDAAKSPADARLEALEEAADRLLRRCMEKMNFKVPCSHCQCAADAIRALATQDKEHQ
jgi:hypothetical protein